MGLTLDDLPNNRERWEVAYYDELVDAVRRHPDEYAPDIDVFRTYNRMLEAFEKGTFNKDSRAIRATCRRLGINHTYKAIKEYRES